MAKEKRLKVDMPFEEAIKKAATTPLFKKMTIAEMHNIQKGRVWEIKLQKEEETIFAKLMMVIGEHRQVGSFDIIHNMFEVDEQEAKPQIETQTFSDDDIESVHLTDIEI